MKDNPIGWIVVIGLVMGGIYLFTNPPQKSNVEKYADCTKVADETHDSSRKRITLNENGYNKAEQASYYKLTEDGYVRNLETCRQLYGQ